MRLPLINNKINQDESSKMLKYAIENGLNYIDTGYSYHDKESEVFLGNFFEKHPQLREKVYVATKLPSWLINKKDDLDYYLELQMKKLKVDKIDFYLLHSLKKDYWKNLNKYGVLDFLDSALEEGKIKYTGFSFHDEFDLFLEIMDAYPWDICQIQLNYMDEHYQAGVEGLKYAASQGIGTVIMTPLLGGCLTRNIPEKVHKLWDMADNSRSPVEWALQYLWDFPEVNVVLSGMSSFIQLKENMVIATKSYPNSLTKNDHEIIKEVRRIYREKIVVNCNSCGYCMPCPQGVNIPQNFNIYNISKMHSHDHVITGHYQGLLEDFERADKCSQCGECVNFCPQLINIPKTLQEVKQTFSRKKKLG